MEDSSRRPSSVSHTVGTQDNQGSTDVTATRSPTVRDYHDFYWAAIRLKAEVMHCRSKFRPIGSCAAITITTHSMISHLAKLRTAFGVNAFALFPDDTSLKEKFSTVPRPEWSLYLTETAKTMADLQEDLATLNQEFRKYGNIFTDERLSTTITLLASDLQVHFFFMIYEMDVKPESEKASREGVHLLLEGFSVGFRGLEVRLKGFVSEGLPVISSTLQSRDDRYLKMTTIATFFSGVTATVLQETYKSNGNSIEVATNIFLLSSIVFSATSAVSSFLAMAWNRSVVRNSEEVLSVWANGWLQSWPMLSLLISGLLFFAGLCCFVISSSQSLVSQVLIYTFVAVNGIGLICLTVRLTFEEWKVRRHFKRAGLETTHGLLALDIIDGLEGLIRFMFIGDKSARRRTNVHVEDGKGNPGPRHHTDSKHGGHRTTDAFELSEHTQVLSPAHINAGFSAPSLRALGYDVSDREGYTRGTYRPPMTSHIPDNTRWMYPEYPRSFETANPGPPPSSHGRQSTVSRRASPHGGSSELYDETLASRV
ncbi:hypothetical protein M0805_003639 [Coniferiporia weirii]|nr:hypothetical protein M0805_003639 [Coniferiporia weirii]